jgi:hypothetical protein
MHRSNFKKIFKRSSESVPSSSLTPKQANVVISKQEKQIKTIKRKLRTIDSPELKFITNSNQTFSTNFTNSTPVAPILLNGCARNTGDNARIGDRVYYKNMELNLQLIGNKNTGAAYNSYVRVLVFVDRNPRGTATTISSLFGVTTPPVMSIYNYQSTDFRKRYRVLFDRLVKMVPASWNGTTPFDSNQVIRIKRKLGFQTDYSLGTAGTIADIDTNSVHICALTDDSSASDIAFTGSYILYYSDV